MKLKLSTGRDIIVDVHHVDDETHPEFPEKKLRGTKILVKVDGQKDIVSRLVCKPPDQFSKNRGRKRAAKHLMKLLHHKQNQDKFTRQERSEIFKAVCSEYFGSQPKFDLPKLGCSKKDWADRAVKAIRDCLSHDMVQGIVAQDKRLQDILEIVSK